MFLDCFIKYLYLFTVYIVPLLRPSVKFMQDVPTLEKVFFFPPFFFFFNAISACSNNSSQFWYKNNLSCFVNINELLKEETEFALSLKF